MTAQMQEHKYPRCPERSVLWLKKSPRHRLYTHGSCSCVAAVQRKRQKQRQCQQQRRWQQQLGAVCARLGSLTSSITPAVMALAAGGSNGTVSSSSCLVGHNCDRVWARSAPAV